MKKILFALVLIVPMLAFTSCGGDDDDEPNIPNQTLNVGQTYTIPGDGTWVSDNDLIASVEGKVVKGIRVGEVAIRDGGKSFKVAVNPTITLFKEPYLNFGANTQTVKNAMNGFEYVGEDEGVLTYIDKTNSVGYGYSFEASKLKMSMVIANSSIATAKRMGEYLAERYVPVTSKDDYIGMVSPDKKMLVVLMIKVQYGKVVYAISYAPASNSKSRSDECEKTFEEIIDAIPGELVKGGLK